MSFINWPPAPAPVFPLLYGIPFPVHKKPIFAATQHKSVTGKEYQTARQAYPNWEFELTFGNDAWLREQTQNISPYAPNVPHTELQAISQLFLTCYGAYGEFYFDDTEDDSRLGQPVAVGDGATTIFLIFRTWGTGQLARPEPVGGVNLGQAINVYLNGVLQSSAAYAVSNDLSGSHLVFGTAPGAGVVITMDFSFYYRCRFLEDMEQFEQFNYNLWELKSVKFRSTKP